MNINFEQEDEEAVAVIDQNYKRKRENAEKLIKKLK